MLRRIHIHNHALIHEVELDLEEGFHVFTGETGSGKSILLGAVGLLLGQRADTAGIGLHGDRAVVEGHFSAPSLDPWLLGQDLPSAPSLHVRREVLRNGRSRVFINDAQATVGQLRELGAMLVDIHRQDDAGIALERTSLCELLDAVGQHSGLSEGYAKAYRSWTEAKSEWQKLRDIQNAPQGDLGYLQHQIQELQALSLQDLDWPALEAELKSLTHAADLTEGLDNVHQNLAGAGKPALEHVEQALRSLRKLAGVDRDVDTLSDRLDSMRIELRDLAETAQDLSASKMPDPSRLQALTSRHDLLLRAVKKHNVEDPERLSRLLADLQQKAQDLEGLEEALAAAQQSLDQSHHVMMERGLALRDARILAADQVTQRVVPLLSDLKMPHAQMSWDLEDTPPDLMGVDTPWVLFSSNPGSSMQPLNKVASGGERARFLLALKSVLAHIHSTPVVVLDEIDTGVSGEVASFMGSAMKNIASASHTRQVLSVPHLPQVAAQADVHWEVQKITDGATTEVQVHRLAQEGRVRAIATMLSASSVTKEAMGQATQLLDNA